MGSSDEDEDSKQHDIIKQYNLIEEALREIIRIQGRPGILTDYVILSAVQDIDSDGVFLTNTGWHTNPANGVPYHRMIGLLEYNRALMLKEAVEVDEL